MGAAKRDSSHGALSGLEHNERLCRAASGMLETLRELAMYFDGMSERGVFLSATEASEQAEDLHALVDRVDGTK